MNTVTHLFSLMPSSFGSYFTTSELLGLREVCSDICTEVTEAIKAMREAADNKDTYKWVTIRNELKACEWGPEPDERASKEMSEIIENLVTQRPLSAEMNPCYEKTALLLQKLIYQHASAVYGGSKGMACSDPGAEPPIPCNPSRQMYYAINCVTERSIQNRDCQFPSGIMDCFKIMFKASVQYLSENPYDHCGWGEVEYLLAAVIVGLRLPVPGSHYRFRYESLCATHIEFLNPNRIDEYSDLFDLFEFIASSDPARYWQLDNFVNVLQYISGFDTFDSTYVGDVPKEVLTLQAKVVTLYCYKLEGVTITEDYQHSMLMFSLKALIKKERRDLLEIIFTKWLPTLDPQPMLLSFFTGHKTTRRMLLYCMRTWTNPSFIAEYFTEALLRKEKCFIEFLWRFKNDAVSSILDEDGNTPLLVLAGVRGRTEKMIRFLIDNGADPKARNRNGESALDRARAINNKKLVKFLTNEVR